MISNSEEIVPVPFPFEHREKRTILAFTADKARQDLAVEAGADIGVGPDIIKKILKGQFRIDDYDFCVAHTDMGSSILPLRGILKFRFPSVLNGAYGEDLPGMIKKFLAGIKLNIKGDPVFPHWGLAEPVIGRLGMASEELEANVATIIEALCKHRSATLGPFINRAVLMVPPGTAFFAVDISKYEPVATEEEMEKKQTRKKKKKKTEESFTEKPDSNEYLLTLM